MQHYILKLYSEIFPGVMHHNEHKWRTRKYFSVSPEVFSSVIVYLQIHSNRVGLQTR